LFAPLFLHTIEQVFDGHADSLVEGAGVGRRLERQTELLVAGAPVVERRHHLVVLKVFADGTTQHHLQGQQRASLVSRHRSKRQLSSPRLHFS